MRSSKLYAKWVGLILLPIAAVTGTMYATRSGAGAQGVAALADIRSAADCEFGVEDSDLDLADYGTLEWVRIDSPTFVAAPDVTKQCAKRLKGYWLGRPVPLRLRRG